MIDRLPELRQAQQRLEQQQLAQLGISSSQSLPPSSPSYASSLSRFAPGGVMRGLSASPKMMPRVSSPGPMTPRTRSRLLDHGHHSSGSVGAVPEDPLLQRFLEQLEAVRKGPLQELQQMHAESRTFQQQALGAISAAQERQALKQVETCAERASRAASRVCKALQEISAGAQKSPDTESGEANVRQQSLSGVMVLFQNSLNEFFAAQQAFKTDMQAKVSRQLRAAFPDADDAAVATIVENRGSAAATIEETLLRQPGTTVLRTSTALDAALERCDELEHLNQAARELRQAFADVESLVITQGEAIDDIGRLVQATRESTQMARHYIQQARNNRRAGRRCGCVTFVFVLIGLTILAVYLIVTFWKDM